MNKFFLITLFILPVSAHAQKIISEQKDAFTNIRTLVTSIVDLKVVAFHPILQANASIDVSNDTLSKFTLAFIIPDLPISVHTSDTMHAECLLKTADDKIIRGDYVADSKAFIVNKSLHSFIYVFSKDDLSTLAQSMITDVKFFTANGDGGLYHVDDQSRGKIAKLCRIVIQKMQQKP